MRPQSTQRNPLIELRIDGDLDQGSNEHRVFLAEGETFKILNGRPVSVPESLGIDSTLADSSAIANTAVRTAYDQALSSLTRAPNAGDRFQVLATGEIGDRGSSDTITWELDFAGETFVLPAVTLSGSTETFHLEFAITIRDADDITNATFWVGMTQGKYGSTNLPPYRNLMTGGSFEAPWETRLIAQFSAADAANTTTLENLTVEYHRS